MKKIFYAVATIAVLGLASCGETLGCYEITTSYKLNNKNIDSSVLVYGTRNDINLVVDGAKEEAKELEKELGVKVNVTKKKVNKNQSDCFGVSASF